jgi:hypothetical protein
LNAWHRVAIGERLEQRDAALGEGFLVREAFDCMPPAGFFGAASRGRQDQGRARPPHERPGRWPKHHRKLLRWVRQASRTMPGGLK